MLVRRDWITRVVDSWGCDTEPLFEDRDRVDHPRAVEEQFPVGQFRQVWVGTTVQLVDRLDPRFGATLWHLDELRPAMVRVVDADVALLNHYHANGRKEGRIFHCPPTLSERCKRLSSSWDGTAEGRSSLETTLSCHINASRVPHDAELRDAFCTSSRKMQLSNPPPTALTSSALVATDSPAGCDLHALASHLEARGQLLTTCSDAPAAAASRPHDPPPAKN